LRKAGCIEALSSGWALKRQAEQLVKEGNKTILDVTGSLVEPTSLHVAIAAELGDEKCRELLRKAGKYIGIGIANAIALLNPEKIIIGGRLIKNNSFLVHSIIESVKKETIEALYSESMITTSELDDASAIGAATMCIKDYFT
jgi:predicted NBD/HSP70 family sugar kinase